MYMKMFESRYFPAFLLLPLQRHIFRNKISSISAKV